MNNALKKELITLIQYYSVASIKLQEIESRVTLMPHVLCCKLIGRLITRNNKAIIKLNRLIKYIDEKQQARKDR